MSPKKSNKHKREVTDKEYSKNNSSQSMNLDVQTYDSNNYISGKKLELFYSQGDHTSEYRTMTDIGMYILINIVIKCLTTPMVYTVKKMFSLKTLFSSATFALKHLSENLNYIYIKERTAVRNHICATFVVNHFHIETHLEKVCCYDISKSLKHRKKLLIFFILLQTLLNLSATKSLL